MMVRRLASFASAVAFAASVAVVIFFEIPVSWSSITLRS